jgi:hypothetical protein
VGGGKHLAHAATPKALLDAILASHEVAQAKPGPQRRRPGSRRTRVTFGAYPDRFDVRGPRERRYAERRSERAVSRVGHDAPARCTPRQVGLDARQIHGAERSRDQPGHGVLVQAVGSGLGRHARRACSQPRRGSTSSSSAVARASFGVSEEAIGAAQRPTVGATWDDSPPLMAARLPASTTFMGTGAARSGLINSMGMGKTIVEFWFDPMSSNVCM